MIKRRLAVLLVSMALVVLASCGGGGSEAFNPPPPPNSGALPITAANAQDITEAVLEAITSTVEIVQIVDIFDLPVLGRTDQGLAKFMIAAIFPVITACDSGEVTSTWNDADNDLAISTGDTFDVLFDMCFFADLATTLDGAASLTNLVVTGDPFNEIVPWELATTFGFDNLSATDSAGPATIDGSLDLNLSTIDNVVVRLTITTASLTAQQSGISETLSAYLLNQTLDLNVLTQVISTSGTLTSTELAGSVTFETLQEFMIIGGDNPSAGQLLISDGNSSVLVTVLDNLRVQLDIDLDLNGTIDETLVVSWDALDID